MAENERVPEYDSRDCFKEAVCIDAMRVYDSCSDKDCLEDLRVLFPAARQALVDSATNARIRDVSVPHRVHRPAAHPVQQGLLLGGHDVLLRRGRGPVWRAHRQPGAGKRRGGVQQKGNPLRQRGQREAVLLGPQHRGPPPGEDCRVLPKATVQVAEPVALSARLCDRPQCGCEPYCRIPESIAARYGGGFEDCQGHNALYATIGLFTIVQLVRNVQMLIPAYDFCVPEKECVASSDNPCELFRRIDFPTEEFFPPRAGDLPDGSRCCGR